MFSCKLNPVRDIIASSLSDGTIMVCSHIYSSKYYKTFLSYDLFGIWVIFVSYIAWLSSSDYLICSNRALRMTPCELNNDNILYVKAYDCLLCNYCGKYRYQNTCSLY